MRHGIEMDQHINMTLYDGSSTNQRTAVLFWKGKQPGPVSYLLQR